MNCNYFRITNYNNVQEGYYSVTGCTGDITISQIGTLQTQYVCADNVTEEYYGAPLDIVNIGLCPSTTPTNTPTPTVTPTLPTPTPTPTITSTHTPTPTITPTIVYVENLITGGYYEDVCQSFYYGTPSNTVVYSQKPFSFLVPGDHVYGNTSLTIPPYSKGTISNGGKFIQISGTLVINVGVC
jgi:type V secretory pathway adhesin AidA